MPIIEELKNKNKQTKKIRGKPKRVKEGQIGWE